MDTEQKAERARALLSDELLQEAIADIRESALDALTGCDPRDVNGLQFARLRLGVADEVLAELKRHIQTHTIQKGRHRD